MIHNSSKASGTLKNDLHLVCYFHILFIVCFSNGKLLNNLNYPKRYIWLDSMICHSNANMCMCLLIFFSISKIYSIKEHPKQNSKHENGTPIGTPHNQDLDLYFTWLFDSIKIHKLKVWNKLNLTMANIK